MNDVLECPTCLAPVKIGPTGVLEQHPYPETQIQCSHSGVRIGKYLLVVDVRTGEVFAEYEHGVLVYSDPDIDLNDPRVYVSALFFEHATHELVGIMVDWSTQ